VFDNSIESRKKGNERENEFERRERERINFFLQGMFQIGQFATGSAPNETITFFLSPFFFVLTVVNVF
jgi:hypothetical protein